MHSDAHVNSSDTALLLDQMFRDRTEQFNFRNGWSLPTDGYGRELDQYDDVHSQYLIIHNEGRHLASLRIRDTTFGCMTVDHFPELSCKAHKCISGKLEITRLCSSPNITAKNRQIAHWWLLTSLYKLAVRNGSIDMIGVVYPSVRRLIAQTGWPSALITSSTRVQKPILLCQWSSSPVAALLLAKRGQKLETDIARFEAVLVSCDREKSEKISIDDPDIAVDFMTQKADCSRWHLGTDVLAA